MRLQVGGLAEHVHDLDDLGQRLPRRGAAVELGREQGRVEVPRPSLGVDEHGPGAEVGDRVDRADEGEVGADDLVARAPRRAG